MLAARLLTLLAVLVMMSTACRKAEFRCRTGRCIPQNLYCDGVANCADKSDEPPHCSPCNRTYYGEEGRTYDLELRQPRRDRLPHICQLNFIADGKSYGDLLELVFDTFSLGRFTSHVHNGCPDGHMQIVEVGQIHNDGYWCGNAYGFNVYYSETGNVRVTFRLYRLSEGGSNFGVDEASQFYIKLRYKFVSKMRAVMREGNKGSKFLGIVVHKSFCDFMFNQCDRDRCRIQSPNFPGMYPRNVTCSYHITHNTPPPGTRALLVLSQRYGELINIKASDGSNGGVRELRTWSKCDVVRDFVTVYDGVTKSSPKLLKFCAGATLPPLISSGPNMIVEFRTSAFDRLTQPTFSADKRKYPTSYMPGFELEVGVKFVNVSDRTRYVDSKGCNYVFSSTSRTRGVIYSPAHSLPSNTTCRYTLLGRSHERLWIYFLQYHVTYHAGYDKAYGSGAKSRHCHHRLDLTDGAPGDGANRSLGFFCGDTKPRLCSRALRAGDGAAVPPCGKEESYLSQAENVTLLQRHVTGLGLDTVSFQLRYEFVDMREDGQQMGDKPCHRVFASRGRLSKGTFGPARNVFLYGRGGRDHLRCLFRFEGTAGERVRILVNKFTAADESGCETVRDESLGRYQCRYHGRARSELRLAEVPWPGVRLWRDCVCADRNTGAPIVVESTASVLELQYDVFNMTADEDFYSYSFIAKYEFLRKTACKTETRINGSSGATNLERREESEGRCDALPWMLEASPSAFLYLSVAGRRQAPGVCQTPTRLVVSAPDLTEPLAVICPGGSDMVRILHLAGSRDDDVEMEKHLITQVEVFSAGWHRTSHRSAPLADHQRHLVLDVVQAVPGQPVKVTWLELLRPEVKRSSADGVQGRGHRSEAWTSEPCRHMCPELAGGCIAPHLWCDDVQHCPSGRDEAPEICHRWSIPWLYVGVGGSAVFIIALLCIAALVHQRQKRPPQDGPRCNASLAINPHEKRLPTDETLTTSGLYSGSSSLKNGKDLISVPSTYSMDSADVDLVETTV